MVQKMIKFILKILHKLGLTNLHDNEINKFINNKF
jgi:hypothetical protein